eukprot:3245245-Prymnesium_polylepis.2
MACGLLPAYLLAMPHFEWLTRVPVGDDATIDGHGIAHDGSGGMYVTGQFQGTVSLGGAVVSSCSTHTDIFVMHVNRSGHIAWAIRAGGLMDDRGLGIASDGKGGAFVAGEFSGNASFGQVMLTSNGGSDVFVMRVDSSGAVIWAKHAGSLWYDHGYAVAADGKGGVFVTGGFEGHVYFGSRWLTSVNTRDAFVWHIRSSGATDWAVQLGSVLNAYGCTVASDDAGGALVAGSMNGQLGITNVFLMRVSEVGLIVWSSELGLSRYRYITGIMPDGQGGAFVTGSFIDVPVFGSTSLASSSNSDTYVARVNSTGGVVWAVQIDSDYSVVSSAIVSDGAGGVLATGHFACWASCGSETIRTTAFSPSHNQACAYVTDIFVIRFDENGVVLWMVQAGGESRDSAAGLARDGVGGVVLLGSVEGLSLIHISEPTRRS